MLVLLAMVVASDAPVGRLGRYELLARLGGGGMAEVYRARIIGAEGFSRTVAIKRVLPGYSENPQFAEMFIAEARVCSRMSHPNVVSVADFDRDAQGGLFLVMELVEGVDLDQLANGGPLPLPVILYIATEILRGLGYAHDLPDGGIDASGRQIRGVVHRDVSPHNVLLSWEGAVKVSDFGIAKARAQSAATASAMIKGKPAYMSPEQANGQAIDGRSDLFAVGIILWELLTSERLFTGDTCEALAQVFFRTIPPPSTLRTTPRDLEAVVLRLLSRDITFRYARAEDAIHDLAGCQDAPRDGRSELVRLLAERFAHAPRTARTVDRSTPSMTPPPSDQPTIHAKPGQLSRRPPVELSPRPIDAVAGLPVLGTAADRPPIKRWPLIVVVTGLLLVAIAVVVAVSGRTPRAPAAVAPLDAHPSPPTPADAAPAVIDAAVAAPSDVVDASLAAPKASPPDARPKHRRGDRGDKQIHEVDIGNQ